MHYTWDELIDIINALARKHGGTAYRDDGRSMDWGQAICYGFYGPDWSNDARFIKDNQLPGSIPVRREVMTMAQRWLLDGPPSYMTAKTEGER